MFLLKVSNQNQRESTRDREEDLHAGVESLTQHELLLAYHSRIQRAPNLTLGLVKASGFGCCWPPHRPAGIV